MAATLFTPGVNACTRSLSNTVYRPEDHHANQMTALDHAYFHVLILSIATAPFAIVNNSPES
jgi:hypothetical protein